MSDIETPIIEPNTKPLPTRTTTPFADLMGIMKTITMKMIGTTTETNQSIQRPCLIISETNNNQHNLTNDAVFISIFS